MRNFLKLASGVDVMPLLHALQNKKWWNSENIRQIYKNSAHSQVDDVLLRFSNLEHYKLSGDIQGIGDDLEALDFPAWKDLIEVHEIIFDLMRRVRGKRLGRVMITRLAPGKCILPHADTQGQYANYYTRYHVVLQNLSGSLFRCGEENVCMTAGEVWWFNAALEHEVVNNSKDDRITLIVDIKI